MLKYIKLAALAMVLATQAANAVMTAPPVCLDGQVQFGVNAVTEQINIVAVNGFCDPNSVPAASNEVSAIVHQLTPEAAPPVE